jgi:hypothetical protein
MNEPRIDWRLWRRTEIPAAAGRGEGGALGLPVLHESGAVKTGR